MSAVIHVRDGRPPVIERDGWTVYVSVRDAAYMQGKRDWRQRLASVHPDRGGRHELFLNHQRAYQRWRIAETQWYEAWPRTA